MNALYKVGHSFPTGMLCGSCSFGKFRLRSSRILLCKRTYKLPVGVYEGEMKLKKTDNVALDSEILYRLRKPKRLRAAAIVSNIKTLGIPVLVGIIYNERHGNFMFHSEYAMELMSQSLMLLTETQCYAVASVTLALGIILNRYACLHPLRIYMEKNSNKFVAVYMNSFLPWRLYKHEFTTVKPSFKTLLLGKKRAILHDDYFKTPAHQYKLRSQLVDDHSM